MAVAMVDLMQQNKELTREVNSDAVTPHNFDTN